MMVDLTFAMKSIRAAFCDCVVPWFAVGLSEQHSVSV